MKLDATDHKILELLQQDGRMTVKEISSHLHLSSTPIFERIKKLERAGIIDHYTVVLNQEKLGRKLHAFAHISLKDHSKTLVANFVEQIMSFEAVRECHYVTGASDFIISIWVDDMEEYKEFVMERLFEVPNIGKVESYLSLTVERKKGRQM
ncbi:MAG: Lrp/AsnC family transcriptional regulator [Bacteroidota bacterium]